MHAHSYLKSAIQILTEYQGEEPLSSFLKRYFGRNKKFGSKDRKHISHLCYCYFRMGKALLKVPAEERILIGLFLCSNESSAILEELNSEWNKKAASQLREKLLIVNYSLFIEDVFPWKKELSEGIDYGKFCESFFVQPGLFLRLRPGYENIAKAKLANNGVNFSEINSTCLSLNNASKIENIIELDKEAVVQDLNSQQTASLLKNFELEKLTSKPRVWDCCAGSGGKSLMLYDLHHDIELTVSDIRESVLVNLKKRFAKARLRNYQSIVLDLTRADSKSQISRAGFRLTGFDVIICDAPCTGSGTWSRTPEQLYFFDDKTEEYSVLQKKIVSNIIPSLKTGGSLLYITCSVFKKENEEVVEFLQNNFELELIEKQLLKGYDHKADTLFAALLKKNS
jgi:16S rRNA (cytosine967-C5)-methyltransferase